MKIHVGENMYFQACLSKRIGNENLILQNYTAHQKLVAFSSIFIRVNSKIPGIHPKYL